MVFYLLLSHVSIAQLNEPTQRQIIDITLKCFDLPSLIFAIDKALHFSWLLH